jgi:hypothetical protein
MERSACGSLDHHRGRALHIPLTAPAPCLNAAGIVAAGYRASGFVLWHRPADCGAATFLSAVGGRADAAGGCQTARNIDPPIGVQFLTPLERAVVSH